VEVRLCAGGRQRRDRQAGQRLAAHYAGDGAHLPEVGLPDGAFQVLVGPGTRWATTLQFAARRYGAFTGSFAVGVNIVRQAADTVKKVSLELGGKSPNIVFNDADFEAAVQARCWRVPQRRPSLRRRLPAARRAGAFTIGSWPR